MGILLAQAWMLNVAAKPLSLYRIDGNSIANSEKNTRQLAYSNDVQQSAEPANDEYVEDFSEELYDEAHIPSERMLYQNEVEKLVKERREMFTRNLASMSVSVSLSFAVIIAPPTNPTVTASGEEESSYDILRDKLLGDDAKDEDDEASIDKANDLASSQEPNIMASGDEVETSYDILREKLLGDDGEDEDDAAAIDKANELASSEEGKVSGLMLTEAVETASDYSAVVVDSKTGYVALRAKLLGKGGDEEFDEDIDEDIEQANELAANKDIVTGGPKKNLRRR
jgi:hypothetical protein